MGEEQRNGGDAMPVTLEKARLNVWNLAGFIIGIAVTAFGWGMTYNSMSGALEKQSAEIKIIKEQLPAITQLQFQMTRATEAIGENKAGIVAANQRADRIVESFGGKLDDVNVNLNKIATRIEVLSTKMEDGPKRTRFPVLRSR